MRERLAIGNDRTMLIGSLRDMGELYALFDRPFAVMLPAFVRSEVEATTRAASELVTKRCLEFCCVGPDAEFAHDSIDDMLEARGALDVVTTWHNDVAEGCEYFVLAAGGRTQLLVALVGDRPEAIDALRLVVGEPAAKPGQGPEGQGSDPE